MKKILKEISDELDNIIRSILPHTGNFRSEVLLLGKKQEYFDKIDVLISKYDEMIKELKKDEIK